MLAVAMFVVAGVAAELFNAAIEALLDRLHPEQHREIGAAKEMASAAAFTINAAALVTFAFALLS